MFAREISGSLFQVNSPALHSSHRFPRTQAGREAKQLGMGQEFVFLVICHMVWIAREELSNQQEVLHLDGLCLFFGVVTLDPDSSVGKAAVAGDPALGLVQTRTIGGHALKDVEGGTSLAVQWLRLRVPNAGSLGSIPGQGTRSHRLQLRCK